MTPILDSPLLDADSPLNDRQKWVITRVSNAERASILALPTDDPLDPKRRARVEATYGEMFGQPQAIIDTWRRNESDLSKLGSRITDGSIDHVFLVGAGDSLAVMIAARRAFEIMLGIPVEPVQCLEFAYYQHHRVTDRSLVIALSSSGETTRTVEALLVAQHANAFTLAVTNTVNSSLEQESASTLVIEATRVGWPTQSSTAALALLLRLAVEAGLRRNHPQAKTLAHELSSAPTLIADLLHLADQSCAQIAAVEAARKMYLFSAAGPNWAAAIVGAAKVKETTPDHAIEIQVEEYHHYNTQKPNEPLFLFAPSGPSVPRASYTGQDARRYGGQFYAITTVGERAFDDAANMVLHLPKIDETLSPLLYMVPAHMIGYHLGMAKFAQAERQLHG